jgi:uncharacterized repeat protein (TIGR01451 family)
MRTQIINIAIALLGFSLLSTTQAKEGINVTYQEPLEQVQIEYASGSREQSPGTKPAQSLRFDAFGKRFALDLEVNRALLDTGQRALLGKGFEIFRGSMAGVPNSWVRIVIADEVPRGMLWDGSELWAIEAVRDPLTGNEKAYIYRLSDVHITPGALACSEISTANDAGELAQAVLSEVTMNATRGLGATSQIDVAVIGDFEFTSAKGSSANAELTTRLNNVDGIFSAQLGVQINVNRIDTFSTNSDPFTDQTVAATLLGELSSYRFATPEQQANGLSHLFTGRDLDTSIAGISYTGGLCSHVLGAGVTQGTHSVTMDSLIAAHEIGHNFGAPHDGVAGSPCESEPGSFLMAPQFNGSDTFSSCSIAEMQARVDTANCISTLLNADVAVVAGGQPAAVLLGDTVTVTFDVDNVGTDTAGDVTVDITIPTGVALGGVSATAGDCAVGAGTASCAIGTIAAGSGATVTITATTTAVGDVDFVASVTADADQNSNNNQATAQVTVDPAVDLVSVAAAAQVTLNTSATIRPSVENRASIAATDVTVVVTPGAGINIDSASWSPGDCSVANNVATCQAISLAAQSNNELQIGITGTSEGSRSYSMSVNAAEIDRDNSNNDASGQVVVGPAGNGSSGGKRRGGGGALDWLSVLFLVFAGLMSSVRVTDACRSFLQFCRRGADPR